MKAIFAKCKECNDEYIISIEEQKFYDERRLTYPKRCYHCRQLRKKTNQEATNVRT